MAKKAFEGAEGYDYTQALSISSEKLLKDFDVKHSTITVSYTHLTLPTILLV